MSSPAHSLRALFAWFTGAIVVLALGVAAMLVVVTSQLHDKTERLAAAVESIYVLEEAELELLLHARVTDDALIARELESSLRAMLRRAEHHISFPDERAALQRAVEQVEAYFATARRSDATARDVAASHAAAYDALESVVAINLAHSRADQARALVWNETANLVGLLLAGALVVGTALFLIWLRRRAFQPVFELARVMHQFGEGDREVRAHETGPAELRQMTTQFNEMATAIATQRQAQMAFLGGIAHDLRQPLSALHLSLQMLDTDLGSPNERRRLVGVAGRQTSRLERMIGDLLEVVKIEAGELELRLGDEDLRALVRQVVELHQVAELHQDGVVHDRLRVQLPAEPVLVRCDALRVEQVITNLLSNALKYSPADQPVAIELATTEAAAILSVTDRGAGISQADQQRLFEPFRRVGPSRHAAPGIGLGLFVVRRIVTAHGGRVEVASSPGQGATFTVHLPLRGAGKRAPVTKDSSHAA
jgi:two-component system, OmpR family, sensor histidine kinase MtrB